MEWNYFKYSVLIDGRIFLDRIDKIELIEETSFSLDNDYVLIFYI